MNPHNIWRIFIERVFTFIGMYAPTKQLSKNCAVLAHSVSQLGKPIKTYIRENVKINLSVYSTELSLFKIPKNFLL